MSTRDMNPEDDAKFEAFLRKEDELAQLLQELPQPQPSAELDAAILADADAALARDGDRAAQIRAANDPAFPGGAHRPSFLTRWKLPLSMAAAALLTVSLVWMQHGSPDGEGPIQVAQAPAPAPAAAPAAPAMEAAAPPPARAQENELKLAEAGAAKAPDAKPKALQKKSAAKTRTDNQATQLAQAEPSPPQAGASGYVAPEPTVIAKADIPEVQDAPARSRIVTRSIMAKPVAPAAPAPPAPAASGASVSSEAAAQPEAKAEAQALTQSQARDAAARKESSPPPPPVWLKRIEEKIEAGSQREALEEWAKFRKAFPDYEVPKPLLEKIEKIERLKK